MKCCLLMWYDLDYVQFGELNAKINKVYCDKYGIDLIVCHERRHPSRHRPWEFNSCFYNMKK